MEEDDAPCEDDNHTEEAIGCAWVKTRGEAEVIVELGQGGAELPRHLELEVQPSLQLSSPVKGAWAEVFGLDRDVQLLQNTGQGRIALRFLFNGKGQVAEVAECTRSVSLLVVLVRLGVWRPRRVGAGYGIDGGEVAGQEVCG